ncbi:MAG: hypothetical protein GY754_44185 [bacterium]|nr:hypothetical protein [bacterium]
MNRSILKKIPAILVVLGLLPFFDYAISTITPGTGTATFLKSSLNAQAKKKRKKRRRRKKRIKKISFNFKDMEIAQFLDAMSELLGKNIIVDDKVRGKITISSHKKIPVAEAYNVMKSILEVKGLAVVETKNLIKIIPIKDAIQKNVQIIVEVRDKDNKEGDTTKKSTVDIKVKEEKTITHLIELLHADPNEVSKALSKLKSKNTNIVVFETLNMLIITGTSHEVKGLLGISKALDRVVDGDDRIKGPKGNIQVIHLENANAEEMATVLSRIPFSENAKINTSPIARKKSTRSSSASRRATRTQAPYSKKKKTKLSIIASKETNSLIIAATPQEFKEIRRIIKELDIVREQVLIEALIVEVGMENNWNFGTNWLVGAPAGSVFGETITAGGASISSSNAVTGGSFPTALGMHLGIVTSSALSSIISASEFDENFNILSTPQILTIDNQEAELNVGEEIPVKSNVRTSTTDVQTYTYEYKTVGIKLKITPHITNKERITLDLYQESNLVLTNTDTTTGQPPKLGKRDIKTKITVLDGKTVVVGGLISTKKTETENKVPLLGDIPLLGWLFKTKSVQYKKTNLLVFITPRIVTKQEDIERVTAEKKRIQSRLRQQIK